MTPSPLEGKIFGTLFVVLSVLIVVGYCAFEWKYGRRARRRKRKDHATDDERSA